MTDACFIHFKHLKAPVLLDGCEELLAPMRQIIPAWPFDIRWSVPEFPPCLKISHAGTNRYTCVMPDAHGPGKRLDAVNVVCEMIAELSWEMLRSNPARLCLHGAAIDFDGRLVVFPNARRAGKSTLAACLAKAGRPVFSDDFLPVSFSSKGMILGTANGICPRLRLPIPEFFSARFRTWVADNPGPANRQYKYLSHVDVPPHGRALPIGAIVFLDRQDTGIESPAAISGTDDTTTIENLLHQNFARHIHSRTILDAMQALLTAIPIHRLTYSSAESAAALLQRTFARWTVPVPLLEDVKHLRFQPVDPEMFAAKRPVYDRTVSYVQAPEISVAMIGGSHYLADRSGLGIHRLNQGSLAIWTLLQDPMTLAEICSLIATVFPETPLDTIATDCENALQDFVHNRLIVGNRSTQ